MGKRKIVISLCGAELSALNELAEKERRDPREQAAVIIRAALVQCGVLNEDGQNLGRSPQTPCTSASASAP